MTWPVVEAAGGWSFRARPTRSGYYGEAIRGHFCRQTTVLDEPYDRDARFEFGPTPAAVIGKLKREVFS